ncbi:MAG: CDP-alcohol phosphatidyltransferase family protein [Fidelibacterota bacterium]|nr:MAG: CDP-alcohol phosphatidyltransferase family protein [Candidatus Neomarinimicrobiota bacterium]
MAHIWAKIVSNYRTSFDQRESDDFYTRFISRPIAAVLVILLAYLQVSPNLVTLISLGIHAINIVMLLRGQFFLAGLGFIVVYILDCADGQLAREKNQTSQFGMHFDLTVDFTRETTFFTVLLYMAYPDKEGLLVQALALLVVVHSFYADWLRKQLHPTDLAKVSESPGAYTTFKKKLGIRFWNIGARHFVYTVCLLAERPDFIAYYVLTIGTVLTAQKFYRIFFKMLTARVD